MKKSGSALLSSYPKAIRMVGVVLITALVLAIFSTIGFGHPQPSSITPQPSQQIRHEAIALGLFLGVGSTGIVTGIVIAKLLAHRRSLQAQIQQQSVHLDRCQQELAIAQRNQELTLAELAQGHQTIATLQDELQAAIATTEQQALIHRQQWEAQQQHLFTLEQAAQTQFQTQEQMLDELRGQMAALDGEKQAIANAFNQQENHLQHLQAQLLRAESSNQELQLLGQWLLEKADEAESRNQHLVTERDKFQTRLDDLQIRLWEREDELNWYKNLLQEPQIVQTHSELASLPENVDLSQLSLAIVGGHHRTRREVIHELQFKYGLRKDCREIPPSSEASLDRESIRSRLSNCDLIVVITKYLGHNATEILSALDRSGFLAGEILMVNCRGKSGVIREILTHLAKKAA